MMSMDGGSDSSAEGPQNAHRVHRWRSALVCSTCSVVATSALLAQQARLLLRELLLARL
jgi:hypothetical protein